LGEIREEGRNTVEPKLKENYSARIHHANGRSPEQLQALGGEIPGPDLPAAIEVEHHYWPNEGRHAGWVGVSGGLNRKEHSKLKSRRKLRVPLQDQADELKHSSGKGNAILSKTKNANKTSSY